MFTLAIADIGNIDLGLMIYAGDPACSMPMICIHINHFSHVLICVLSCNRAYGQCEKQFLCCFLQTFIGLQRFFAAL